MRQFRVPSKQKSRPSTNTPSQIALCANSASPQNKSPVLPQTPPAKPRYAPIPCPLKTKVPSFHKHIQPNRAPRQFGVPPKQKSRPSTNTSQPNRAMRQFGAPSKHPSRSFTILPPIYILHNPSLCAILKPVKTTKTT